MTQALVCAHTQLKNLDISQRQWLKLWQDISKAQKPSVFCDDDKIVVLYLSSKIIRTLTAPSTGDHS